MALWSHDVWPFEALPAYERFDSISNYLNGRMNNATRPYTIYVHKLSNYPGFVKIGITNASANLRHIDKEYGDLLYTSCKDQCLMEKLKRDVPKADAFLCEQALFSILERYRQVIPQLKHRRWSGYTETFFVTGKEVRLQAAQIKQRKRKPGYLEGILRAVAPAFFDDDEPDAAEPDITIEYDYLGFTKKVENNIHDLLTGDIHGWIKMMSHAQTLEEHRALATKRESMFREVISRRASASKPKFNQNKDIPRTSKQSQDNAQPKKSVQLPREASTNKVVEQKRPPQVQSHHRLDMVAKNIGQENVNNNIPIIRKKSEAKKVESEKTDASSWKSSQDSNQSHRSVQDDSSTTKLNRQARWWESEDRGLGAKHNDANHQINKDVRPAVTMQSIDDFLREPAPHSNNANIDIPELPNASLKLTAEEKLVIEKEIAFYDNESEELTEPEWDLAGGDDSIFSVYMPLPEKPHEGDQDEEEKIREIKLKRN